jgi:hypothetical protein
MRTDSEVARQWIWIFEFEEIKVRVDGSRLGSVFEIEETDETS